MSQQKIKLTKEWVAKKLPVRPKDANKGTFGKMLVFAGSENYPGAAFLSCAAAYRVGAGLVTLTTEQSVKTIVSRELPELTFLSFGEVTEKISNYNVLLVGPGLGQSNSAEKMVEWALNANLPPTIIDGDGLNILSQNSEWWKRLKEEAILTPHPGEMARLTGLKISEIQLDRINVAQYFTKKWQKVLVLKGANTVIVSPVGETLLAPFGNPILATAGTGDILSGIIAGMLAQGLKPMDAAGVSVYIHGLAGEKLSKQIGNTGALAGDLLPLLPQVIKELR